MHSTFLYPLNPGVGNMTWQQNAKKNASTYFQSQINDKSLEKLTHSNQNI